MKSYDAIDRDLTREYASVREELIEKGLFEEIDIDTEKLSRSFSRLQEILAAKGISQESIDKLIEALWLAVHLGIRDRSKETERRKALEEIQRAL